MTITITRSTSTIPRGDKTTTTISVTEGHLLELPDDADTEDFITEDFHCFKALFLPRAHVHELIKFEQALNSQLFIIASLNYHEREH